jgi:hypothetical protein
MLPGDLGQRQIILPEALLNDDVGPADDLARLNHEGFDRSSAAPELEGAVLRNQAAALGAIRRDQCPVALLPHEGARKRATARPLGERSDEGIQARPELEALQLDLGESEARAWPGRYRQLDETRLGLREPDRVAATVATTNLAYAVPALAVRRECNVVVAGVCGW